MQIKQRKNEPYSVTVKDQKSHNLLDRINYGIYKKYRPEDQSYKKMK